MTKMPQNNGLIKFTVTLIENSQINQSKAQFLAQFQRTTRAIISKITKYKVVPHIFTQGLVMKEDFRFDVFCKQYCTWVWLQILIYKNKPIYNNFDRMESQQIQNNLTTAFQNSIVRDQMPANTEIVPEMTGMSVKNPQWETDSTKPSKGNRWSPEEDKIYIKFLKQNGQLLRSKSVRRAKQTFSLLSKKMGGRRTSAQCKTHHQKMKQAAKNGTIKEIIAHVTQKYIRKYASGPRNFSALKLVEKNDQYEVGIKQLPNYFQINIKIDQELLENW